MKKNVDPINNKLRTPKPLQYLFWRIGAAEICRRILVGKKRFVLEFHGISGQKWLKIPAEVQPSLCKEDLTAILTWLKPRFQFLTPNDFLFTQKPGVLLTFDDGLANAYTNAVPILEGFAAPAIFFVTSQHVRDPKNWLPSIREKARAGWGDEASVPEHIAADFFDGMSPAQLKECAWHPLITIGAHTVSHPFLSQLSQEEITRELVDCKEDLEQISGEQIDLFAYPAGDYNAEVATVVEAVGYQAGFVEDTAGITQHKFEIPRVGLYESSPAYLNLKLSGLHRAAQTGPVETIHPRMTK